MAQLAIVEDDTTLARLMATVLEEEGHTVALFEDGVQARKALAGFRADLIVLDLHLPGLSGDELCKWLRNASAQADVPILAITGSHATRDRYKLFSEGIDDFLTKPFDTFEFVLRIRNRLRRAGPIRSREVAAPALEAGDLVVCADTHTLRLGSRVSRLTPAEFAIMSALVDHLDRPVAVETLLTEALEYPARLGNPDIVRTHVRHLRNKIEDDPTSPTRLVNLPRLGYMLKSAPADPRSVPDAASRAPA